MPLHETNQSQVGVYQQIADTHHFPLWEAGHHAFIGFEDYIGCFASSFKFSTVKETNFRGTKILQSPCHGRIEIHLSEILSGPERNETQSGGPLVSIMMAGIFAVCENSV